MFTPRLHAILDRLSPDDRAEVERALASAQPRHAVRARKLDERDRAIRLALVSFYGGSRHARAKALAADLVRLGAVRGEPTFDPKAISLRQVLALNRDRPLGWRQIEQIDAGARSMFAKISE
jgi:anti-sigma factor RsiW